MNSIPKPNLLSLCCVALLTLLSVRTSYATETTSAAETTSFTSIIVDDVKYEATAPSRWESTEWKNLGWATLAVVGTSIIADRPMRNFMCQQSKETTCDPANTPVNNSFLTTVENFGQTYALGVMGGFYLAGVITDNEKSVQVAQDLVAASLVSATVNQTLKVAVNRYRPRDNQGIDNFQGYAGLNNNSSFPSGHTTEAFTLASVIASSYEDEWVACTVYSLAGLVGVARMYHDAHFASDVVASAFIGTWIGKSVVSHNSALHKNSKNNVSVLPDVAPGYTGVRIVSNF
jgi:hypothetical protein